MVLGPRSFRSAREIIDSKGLTQEVQEIIQQLHDGWMGGTTGLSFQKQILRDRGWATEEPIGIQGRRYAYDGLKDRVAMEIEWSQSEKILPIMLKLQYGFAHTKLDAAVVVNHRGDPSQSPIPDEEAGGVREIREMHCIITVPILLMVFSRLGSG